MLIKYNYTKEKKSATEEKIQILKNVLKYSNKLELVKNWAEDKWNMLFFDTSDEVRNDHLAINQILDQYRLWINISNNKHYTPEMQEIEYNILKKILYIMNFDVIQLEDLLDNYKYTLKGDSFLEDEFDVEKIITEYFKIEN